MSLLPPFLLAAGAGVILAAPVPGVQPPTVVLSSARGEVRLEVRETAEGGLLPAVPLVAALGGQLIDGDPAWAEVRVNGVSFRFLVGSPVVLTGDRVEALGVGASRRVDTLFLPLPLVTHLLPRAFPERYRWMAADLRLVETGPAAAAPRAAPRAGAVTAARPRSARGRSPSRARENPCPPAHRPVGRPQPGSAVNGRFENRHRAARRSSDNPNRSTRRPPGGGSRSRRSNRRPKAVGKRPCFPAASTHRPPWP